MIRIGILTYFASINYGAFLQAYALTRCIGERYKDVAEVEVINYESKIAHEWYVDRISVYKKEERDLLLEQYRLFVECRKVLRLSKDELITDDIEEASEWLRGKYDIIIVGSDEIWKTDGFRGFPNVYWLNFDMGENDINVPARIAYAVSGRNNYQAMTVDLQKYIQNAIRRFEYIGTRDEITRKELLKIERREIERNCDPCFLEPHYFRLSEEEKECVREKFGLSHGRPVISLMINGWELGRDLYRMFEKDYRVLYLCNVNVAVKKDNLVAISPLEWNGLIAVSDLVITNFFHGTVFSMIHSIPFVALEESEKGRGKIEDLLSEHGMNDRLLFRNDYPGDDSALLADLYTKGKEMLGKDISSVAAEAVEMERKKADSFFETMNIMLYQNKGIEKGCKK